MVRQDTAICRTKPEWPEAKSGPAVTSAMETGMREKGWVGGWGGRKKHAGAQLAVATVVV